MTRRMNARLAGMALLLYIAFGVIQMTLGAGASAGVTVAQRLASMSSHGLPVTVNVALGLVTSTLALLLGVAFHGLTRDVDPDWALFGASCRVGEAIVGVFPGLLSLALLGIATQTVAADDANTARAAASTLFAIRRLLPLAAAWLFSLGSLVFSCLLLRGRRAPRWLAWLGVAASALLVLLLPLQLIGRLPANVSQLMWAPMAAFEVILGVRWIVRGVDLPARS
jgi:hypothetical protein